MASTFSRDESTQSRQSNYTQNCGALVDESRQPAPLLGLYTLHSRRGTRDNSHGRGVGVGSSRTSGAGLSVSTAAVEMGRKTTMTVEQQQ
jgi:hypothetical protein